jgi:DNA (cytosine-5)-methyltransferase 1
MNYHFPNSYQHEDIRTTDFTIWRGKIDLITGGFPCQPYSNAGKRKGKADDRHLWPEMLRAIREIQPGWIVGENVRGLISWNRGLVFDEVQADLEAEGYEVIPFLLPAAGVGAPHQRYRIWPVAYSKSRNRDISTRFENREKKMDFVRDGFKRAFANSTGIGQREQTNEIDAITETGKTWPEPGSGNLRKHAKRDWADFPTQSPVCNRNDGIPGGLVDITFSKWRNESIKSLGNAIVPQVAYMIFKAIHEYDLAGIPRTGQAG